jgi:hypothetical protein
MIETFTSASVSAGGTLIVNHTIVANKINITKIKVSPSIVAQGTNRIEFFKKDTCLLADLAYSTDDYIGTLVDPVEDDGGVITERNEGFVVAYEDSDASLELHIQITNNHTVAKTYAFEITYEIVSPYLVVTKATTGDPATADEFTILINTYDNKVKIWADGAWRQLATW